MKEQGVREYLRNWWSCLDVVQAVVFCFWSLMDLESHPKDSVWHELVLVFLENSLIYLLFLQVMHLMRLFRSYGIIIKVVSECMSSLFPFIVYFFMASLMFSLL